MMHYHIRWGTGEVDWERHAARAEAEQSAKQLAHPDDEYTIEESGENCAVCEAGPYGQKRVAGTA